VSGVRWQSALFKWWCSRLRACKDAPCAGQTDLLPLKQNIPETHGSGQQRTARKAPRANERALLLPNLSPQHRPPPGAPQDGTVDEKDVPPRRGANKAGANRGTGAAGRVWQKCLTCLDTKDDKGRSMYQLVDNRCGAWAWQSAGAGAGAGAGPHVQSTGCGQLRARCCLLRGNRPSRPGARRCQTAHVCVRQRSARRHSRSSSTQRPRPSAAAAICLPCLALPPATLRHPGPLPPPAPPSLGPHAAASSPPPPAPR
jgi:hypothetical protein